MTTTRTTLALLAALTALPATTWALQDAAAPSATAIAAVDDGTSIFGDALYVNGERITDMEIKRFLCYGKGRNALEARRLGLLMRQEWELREFTMAEELLTNDYGGRSLEELSDSEKETLNSTIAAAMERFRFNKQEYSDRLEREAADFKRRYPTLDLETEIERAYQSFPWYKDQVRQTMEFDELFFPGHPEVWPEITIEAIHQNSPNFDLVEDYAKNHVLRIDHYAAKRAEAAEQLLASEFGGKTEESLNESEKTRLKGLVDDQEGKWTPREDEMMLGLLRDFVMGALADLVNIDTSIDNLTAEVLMRVEGGGFSADLKTEDVYQEMRHAFTDVDIREAKEFLALMKAAEDELGGLDQLLANEEFRSKYDELTEQLSGTMFQMDFLALQGHMFPSIEAYFRHSFLMESYKQTITADLELTADGQLTPALQSHMTVANGIMGLAKCQPEVLLVSAFDWPNFRWLPGGWAKAQTRALELRAEVDGYLDLLANDQQARLDAAAKGENYASVAPLGFDQWWSELLDLHSDYWDPPFPVEGKMPPAIGLKNKGRFQGTPMTRNDLKRALGESSWSHFMGNTSVVDSIFFEVEEGTVAGPFIGPHGYYIVNLRRKLPPSNPLSITNERHLGMIQEDYLRTRFTAFCHSALEKAEVKGL